MDFKKWLEDGTKLKVAENAFRKAPDLPFLIFDDNKTVRGADSRLCITEHEVNIFLCQQTIEKDMINKINDMLEELSVAYDVNTSYDSKDDFYTTEFSFQFIEKEK